MKIKADDLNFHLLLNEENLDGSKTPVIFLHGFTGSYIDWRFVYNKLPEGCFAIAVDLIGHGASDSPDNVEYYTPDSQIDQLYKIIKHFNINECVLAGYSMGGRLALSFAAKHNTLLRGLILESTTPGIKGRTERKERIKADEELALKIENEGVENFVDYWLNLPMFASLNQLPEEKYNLLRNFKINNNPQGLANSLRGFGTGRMPALWEKIKSLPDNLMLITGELDQKFSDINKELVSKTKTGEHYIVQNAGHNVHLEKPEEFINLVNYFLRKII